MGGARVELDHPCDVRGARCMASAAADAGEAGVCEYWGWCRSCPVWWRWSSWDVADAMFVPLISRPQE